MLASRQQEGSQRIMSAWFIMFNVSLSEKDLMQMIWSLYLLIDHFMADSEKKKKAQKQQVLEISLSWGKKNPDAKHLFHVVVSILRDKQIIT